MKIQTYSGNITSDYDTKLAKEFTMENITKEEWLIRLMQGMVGDYGNRERNIRPCYCWYSSLKRGFRVRESIDDHPRALNINDLYATHDFWITDTRGIEVQPINLHNIGS